MRPFIILSSVLVVASCSRSVPASKLETRTLPVTTSCSTVSGASLGALPLSVEVAGKTVRFQEWTTADEVSTAVFGFAASVPEGVVFTVNAGNRAFTSNQSRWLHPLGVSGTQGIDSVTFCAVGNAPAVALR